MLAADSRKSRGKRQGLKEKVRWLTRRCIRGDTGQSGLESVEGLAGEDTHHKPDEMEEGSW